MNRIIKAVAAVAALLMLAGAALALTSGPAHAAGKTCITQHESGFWARVIIGNDSICRGFHDFGTNVRISQIPNDQAPPAVLHVWDSVSKRPTYRFLYEEDGSIPNAATVPFSLDKDGDGEADDALVDDPRVTGNLRPVFQVLYQPSDDHRTVRVAYVNGNHCYREWRDSQGNWRRSASYGDGLELCRMAAWNTYQRSEGDRPFEYLRRNWTWSDYRALGWSWQAYTNLRNVLYAPSYGPPGYDHASVANAINSPRYIGGYEGTCVDGVRNRFGNCAGEIATDYNRPTSGAYISRPAVVPDASTRPQTVQTIPGTQGTTTFTVGVTITPVGN